MEKDSFIFYRSFAEAIDDLPDQEQLALYRAIKEYSLNETEIELEGQAKTLWKLIKPQLSANNKRYKDGAKGGRPLKNNQRLSEEETTGYETEKPNNNENVNENNNENENGGFSKFSFSYIPPESQEVKEDATVLFNKAREYWNELGIKPECRDIIMRHGDIPDILQTFFKYNWQEIKNAIKNFAWHRTKADRNYHDPPPYGSLAGFLKTGVERYFDDNALDQQFKKALSPDARKDQEINESLEADRIAIQARKKEHEDAKNNAVNPDEVPSLTEILKQTRKNKGGYNGSN